MRGLLQRRDAPVRHDLIEVQRFTDQLLCIICADRLSLLQVLET